MRRIVTGLGTRGRVSIDYEHEHEHDFLSEYEHERKRSGVRRGECRQDAGATIFAGARRSGGFIALGGRETPLAKKRGPGRSGGFLPPLPGTARSLAAPALAQPF
jgi:hypothetical protein